MGTEEAQARREEREQRQRRGGRLAGRKVFTLENARRRDEEGVDVNSWRGKKMNNGENEDREKRLGLRGLAFTDQCYPQLHLHRGSGPSLVPYPNDGAPSEILTEMN